MSHNGQVKWFDPKKGYGFIIGPEGQGVIQPFLEARSNVEDYLFNPVAPIARGAAEDD